MRVTDTGCGIREQEREAVLRRFYRPDKIGSTPGVGLGLSLVAAIVKLHGFRLVIHPGPGGQLAIICPDKRARRARRGPSASRRVEGKAGIVKGQATPRLSSRGNQLCTLLNALVASSEREIEFPPRRWHRRR
jgi:hypothetical protein